MLGWIQNFFLLFSIIVTLMMMMRKKMMFTLLFIVELLALIIIIIVRSFNLVRGLLNSFRELKMRIFYGDMEQVKSKKKKKNTRQIVVS